MLKDEEVISIRRIGDCCLKLIELVRLTCDEKENCIIFRNLHKIDNMDEKIIYLLFVYINNSNENIVSILNDTGINSNDVVNNFLENGINVDELNSDIVKNYLINNSSLSIIDIINKLSDMTVSVNQNYESSFVDYNISHLENENIKDMSIRNMQMKKKIRRKTLYDKYQGRQ